MRPAARLFELGMRNIAPFAPVHHRLDVRALLALCEAQVEVLVAGDFERNPWEPGRLPRVELSGALRPR